MSSVPGREPEPKPVSGLERLAQSFTSTDTVESPRWLVRLRQLIILALGVWIIVHAVTATSLNVTYLITGLILIGIIPVETLLLAASKGFNREKK